MDYMLIYKLFNQRIVFNVYSFFQNQPPEVFYE